MVRIDAHHHLWRYTAAEFDWIDDSMAVLRRDFALNELAGLMAEAGVTATVAVQARQTVEETRWLLDTAAAGSPIAGVVGWLPLASPDFAQELDRFAASTALKGLRHVVQGEPEGFLDGTAFNAGVALLQDIGLVYDILVRSEQLGEVVRFVDRHPQQVFVLDHVGKPAIRSGEIDEWRRQIRALAERPHVSCKVSGMVTEADPKEWSAAQLEPYFDAVLGAFGPDRMMAGSDWPVLNVASNYAEWWALLEEWTAPLGASEQAAILGETAARVYRLDVPDSGKEKGRG